MAETTEAREAREKIRERERAVWTDVEQIGKDLRADPTKQAVTQAESDATGKKPREGMGV